MTIQIDVSNAFNSTNRGLTLDVLNGRGSRDYTSGLRKGDVIPTVDTLTNLFGYFKNMRSCEAKLRYFDWDGQVHVAKGKTGGQQGDPLEMLIFNLTVHHIRGRVLAKFQGARAVEYADDGYIKGKLSVVLQVLAELKRVLKEDAGLEVNIPKTAVLSKVITQQTLFDVAHVFINNSPQLIHLSGELSLDSFRHDGFVGIGVPIVTDNFVRQFVAKKCRDIIEDVEKVDVIEDSFIHFQVLRFCQATRMQHINSHILLDNRCVLQQQHVDVKIDDVFLKKGTKQHTDGWDVVSKDWAHMVLHLPHAEGGFGVPFNCVTKDVAFYTTTAHFVSWMGAFSQERQRLWLPKDDLRDSSSWSSPPLLLLRDIHSRLVTQYDCKEVCASSQPQGNVGASVRLNSQDGILQQQEDALLSLP